MLQSCPTLCDPIDGSPPGSPVLGILQARTLEWVAISFSNAWKWKAKVKSLSRVWLLATPWAVAYQAPPSMGFPGKSAGVGCHCLLHIHKIKCGIYIYIYNGLPRWLSGKESTCSAGDAGSIHLSGRSSGEGNGNPLQ